MIAIGLLIILGGIFLFGFALCIQTCAVIFMEAGGKWTDPLPTLTGLTVCLAIGMTTLLTGLLQSLA